MNNIVGLVRIFDIDDNDELIISAECRSIDILEAVYQKYKSDPLPVFKYINFLSNPYSPYNNYRENEKEEAILNDVGGSFLPDCNLIQEAITRINKLYETPTKRFFESNKVLADRLTEYARTASITAGNNGNLSGLQAQLKNSGEFMKAFKLVENAYKEELVTVVNRGNAESGYDEDE
jgi:hypothetical protein